MKQYGMVMISTTELIVTIVAFIYAGQFIDGYFGLKQKGVIVASILGSVLAFTRFVIRLQKLNKDDDRNNTP